MSVSEIISYNKDGQIERFPLFKKLSLSVTIILVAGLSFGIGRLSVIGNREPVKIEYDQSLIEQPTSLAPSVNQTAAVINAVGKSVQPSSSEVVVSKNGTRYHYLYCGSAKQIKEENKIIFPTPEAAEAAGYTLAANCKPR